VLYVFDGVKETESAKLIVRVNYKLKSAGKRAVNEIVTSGIVPTATIAKDGRYKLIDGGIE
jgi:hypothetical protein